ncbi:MAG TPA: hypothetical protein VLQ79_12310, partial [Myxococcaceae bacterium]|nr:hypothetical protein [Myxococcaceae bacterium]
RRAQSIDESGFVAVRMVVSEPGDGGPDQDVFLSATALGSDTLLCASLRGATPATLDAIERICRGAAERATGG